MLVTRLLLATNVLLLVGLAIAGWRYRDEPGARAFTVLQVVSAVWAGVTLAGLATPAGPLRRRLWGVTTGLSLVVVALWLAFILSYTGRDEWLAPERFGPLAAPLVAGAAAYVVAPSWAPLVGRLEQTTIEAGTVVATSVGPVGLALGVYIYGVVFLPGLLAVFTTVLEGNRVFTGQAVALVVGTLVTVVASLGAIAGVPTAGYPLTQVALGGQSLFWGYAVLRQRFLRVAPAVTRVGERAVFDELDEGVLVVDVEETVLRANPSACAHLDADDLVGEPVESVLDPMGADAVSDLPTRFRHRGRVYRANASTITDWRDVGVGRAIVVQDVTGSARRRQRLEVLNRVLRHDIRNGMNVVLGRAEQLPAETPEAERIVRAIERTGEEIVELSEKARHFESALGEDGVEHATVDVVALVDRVTTAVGTERPDAEIRTDLPDRATVRASELLEYAVRQLVENAIEHNDTDRPLVEVSVAAGGSDDPVAVRIADDGPGLPEQERAVIERGRETPTEHSSGLGLWLATWIVEDGGGELRFAANEPRGTIITVRLPRADATPVRAERLLPTDV